MYLEHFQLARRPFDSVPCEAFVYLTENHMAVIRCLFQAFRSRNSFSVITGEGGVGKSTLLDRFVAQLDEDAVLCRIAQLQPDPDAFLQAVLSGFGFEPSRTDGEDTRNLLKVFLVHQKSRGRIPLLMVEDTQSFSPRVLEELCRLAAIEDAGEQALHIILAGHPELIHVVDSPGMEPLSQRTMLRSYVKPLSEEETGGYLAYRLARAGSQHPDGMFAATAIALIHRYTGGVPGLINTLCETALNCACAAEVMRVSDAVVTEAAEKLQKVPHAGAAYVQGLRSTDAKICKGDGAAQLVLTLDGALLAERALNHRRVVIGRHHLNDICIECASVSRHHAMVIVDAGRHVVVDLNSSNGTFVNSAQINHHFLSDSDIIGIGKYRLKYVNRITTGAASAASATSLAVTDILPAEEQIARSAAAIKSVK